MGWGGRGGLAALHHIYIYIIIYIYIYIYVYVCRMCLWFLFFFNGVPSKYLECGSSQSVVRRWLTLVAPCAYASAWYSLTGRDTISILVFNVV